MLRRLEYICLVGSIALIGADRIDLLGGSGSFRLTPFFVLAVLAILFRLVIIATERGLVVITTPSIQRQTAFVFVLVVFLFLSSISTVYGLDPERGLIQLADVVLVSVLGYFISVMVLAEPARERLILWAVSLGLVVYLVFCIGECIAWSLGVAFQDPSRADSVMEALFAPSSSLLLVPRLSGSAIDANGAGFGLVMYLVLLDAVVPRSRYTAVLRFTIALFVLLGLSRSAMLCLAAYYLFSSAFWKQLTFRRAVSWLAVPAVLFALLWVTYKKEIVEVFELWQVSDVISERLSTGEGTSGGDHEKLIQRGLEIWSSSTRTMIAGIGFGAEPKLLTDFFGDNKYANFHCLYVTVLTDLGLPAFAILLILFGYPILANRGAAPGIAALATFSLPYQAHTSPAFWLALALLWAFKPKWPQGSGAANQFPLH